MTGSQSSVGLVSVDVHGSGELLADSYDDITEGKGTTVAVNLDGNDLLVGNAELCSLFGGEVDVSLCDDNALGDLNLAAGTDELAAGSASDITGLTDRRNKTYLACIGEGKFDLCSTSLRTEDGDTGKLTLGADDGNSLFTCELTGLGKILLLGQSMVCTEKDGKLLFCNVNVTG